MKVIHSDEAHLFPGPTPGATFGVIDNSELFADSQKAAQMRDLLFTEDTIPLSDSQKKAVEALLAHRSVLYMSTAGDDKLSIFVDTVMRVRLWKESIVYCASSRRSAEAMYATLCAQMGPERMGELLLDLGSGALHPSVDEKASRESARVIFTSPDVMKNNLVACDSRGWISDVSVIFIDGFDMLSLANWEEIFLAMPSRVLLCIFTQELPLKEKELLPLWLETIQNPFVTICPPGAASLTDRIESPENFPLLRTFAFNAAIHDSPVQVSLTLLKDMLQKEHEQSSYCPKFEECFLHGIPMIPAENPATMEFGSTEEAEYADVCSLISADAKRTGDKVRARSKRRVKNAKKKERTASSRAAARRRRETDFGDSILLPAIVLTRGYKETENAARAVRRSLSDDRNLLWDEDSRNHLENIIADFKTSHSPSLSSIELEVLQSLEAGVGIVHDYYVPGLRILVEELFRGGLIPLLIADTHISSVELLALPCAKSVLVESSALAVCDDPSKGLIMASTAAVLAGRTSKDDVGNLIVMWYDDSIDDEAAGSEIASTLLYPFSSDLSYRGLKNRPKHGSMMYPRMRPLGSRGKGEGRDESSFMSSSYDGILRSLRRFGVDGYGYILDYTLESYRGWLQRASIHATSEKLDLERKAADEVLESADWESIAEFERQAAKRNEAERVFKAMQERYTAVVAQRLQEELLVSRTGRIIGVRSAKGNVEAESWTQRLLEGAGISRNYNEKGSSDDSDINHVGGVVGSKTKPVRESYSAAVFVALRDQDSDTSRISSLEDRWVVVCILADGMWTTLPVADVVALSSDEDEVVPNVDLLMIPHSKTFDVDPSSAWAKCCPVDETEKAAIHRVSDDLIALAASANRPVLARYEIPEYEAQISRLEEAENAYQKSPWYNRDEELLKLHQLRRRSAELGDEIEGLQKKQTLLEEELYKRHREETSNQSSILAVLEDCHALSIIGDRSMEMTPIGALGSILPGQFPVFTGACLSLIEDFSALSSADFAAFVSTISSSGRVWKNTVPSETNDVEGGNLGDYEELDLSIIKESANSTDINAVSSDPEANGMTSWEDINNLLPSNIGATVNDILSALQQLHRRHQGDRTVGERRGVSDIVPSHLNIRMSRATAMFASGEPWEDVVDEVQHEGGYAVRELRKTLVILEVIATSDTDGEFSDDTRELAKKAFQALDKWPVRVTDTISALVESGVVEKHWNGNTYDKWWRTVRNSVSSLGAAPVVIGSEVENVESEIVEL